MSNVSVLMLKFVSVLKDVLFLSPLEQISWVVNRTVNSVMSHRPRGLGYITGYYRSIPRTLSPPVTQWIQSLPGTSLIDDSKGNSKCYSSQYEKLCILGKGSFATVYLCRDSTTNELRAVKVMKKSLLREMNQIRRAVTERRILSRNHPFIAKLYHSFQTDEQVHLVLEYCAGGDLFTLLDRRIRLNENVAVFYTASIILALQHLHQNHIVYRDLKPENVLIDRDGYVRLTDFGLAKEDMERETKTKSMCGSADYIAPEILAGTGYTRANDLWSLGCITYETLTGYPPFYSGKDRNRVYTKIRLGKVAYPSYLSENACSFISGLLTMDPAKRLGNGPRGFLELIEHPFFRSIDWYSLMTKQMRAPHIPPLRHIQDTGHFSSQFTAVKVSGQFKSADMPTETEYQDFDWCSSDIPSN